jgi:adenine-specific DNA glycosylase
MRGAKLGEFRHSITRHDYSVEVWQAEPLRAPKGFCWIALDELPALPLATTARKAFSVAGRPVPECGE